MQILIVGAGLAGIALAHQLQEEGIDFRILDAGNNVSSSIAGGIINPLVFRRMTLSWRAPEMVDFAHHFYEKIEGKFNQTYYHSVPIRRFFASEQEAGYWQKKQLLPDYAPFMQQQTDKDLHFPSKLNQYGTGVVTQCGYVEAARFIADNLSYFDNLGVLSTGPVDYAEIDAVAGTYQHELYDYIVFCEGKDVAKNPWFGYLPIQPTKGEVLTIESDHISQQESLNRKCFMMPIGGNAFRVGSTYVWETDNTEITHEGRALIEENLTSIVDQPYRVTQQIAGVRPTVPDRRPIFGKHPDYPKLVIANGLGTKGYMIAPLLMYELIRHLTQAIPLHTEVALSRYQRSNVK
jgi:glycine oxidase